jgi:UDP-glucose 4-epimerase
MNILVTGAAGYIGSIVTEELIKEGHFVIALDNLRRGYRNAIHPDALFVLADIADSQKLAQLFSNNQIDAVLHLAAEVRVSESMSSPEKYFYTNVVSGITLLNTMLKHKVNKLVFSSTAAVYGNHVSVPVKETHSTLPINPYGESKLAFERVLHWYGIAYGLAFISLRYFNAAGASEMFGCDHENETLLIPNVLKVASGQQEYLPIFGADYPTRDGSCIRDYIHVVDIANAHILALKHLERGQANKVYNLGNGKGFSVLEVVEIARKVTGADISTVVRPRRDGDLPTIVASSELAKAELGWEPKYPELESIIASAWRWQKDHPYGYGSNKSSEKTDQIGLLDVK